MLRDIKFTLISNDQDQVANFNNCPFKWMHESFTTCSSSLSTAINLPCVVRYVFYNAWWKSLKTNILKVLFLFFFFSTTLIHLIEVRTFFRVWGYRHLKLQVRRVIWIWKGVIHGNLECFLVATLLKHKVPVREITRVAQQLAFLSKIQ